MYVERKLCSRGNDLSMLARFKIIKPIIPQVRTGDSSSFPPETSIEAEGLRILCALYEATPPKLFNDFVKSVRPNARLFRKTSKLSKDEREAEIYFREFFS